MNRVILLGNVGKDPEIRASKSKVLMAVFTLATDTRWMDTKGEPKQKTDWHKVVVFKPKLVSWCEQYLKKGAKVIVEGQFHNRKQLTQDGEDFYSSEIVIGAGYGCITSLSPLPTDSQESEENEDRVAVQQASAQHSSAIQQDKEGR